MTTHSNILAWRTPQKEEPGGLMSMESQSWTRLSNLTTPSWTYKWPTSCLSAPANLVPMCPWTQPCIYRLCMSARHEVLLKCKHLTSTFGRKKKKTNSCQANRVGDSGGHAPRAVFRQERDHGGAEGYWKTWSQLCSGHKKLLGNLLFWTIFTLYYGGLHVQTERTLQSMPKKMIWHQSPYTFWLRRINIYIITLIAISVWLDKITCPHIKLCELLSLYSFTKVKIRLKS